LSLTRLVRSMSPPSKSFNANFASFALALDLGKFAQTSSFSCARHAAAYAGRPATGANGAGGAVVGHILPSSRLFYTDPVLIPPPPLSRLISLVYTPDSQICMLEHCIFLILCLHRIAFHHVTGTYESVMCCHVGMAHVHEIRTLSCFAVGDHTLPPVGLSWAADWSNGDLALAFLMSR